MLETGAFQAVTVKEHILYARNAPVFEYAAQHDIGVIIMSPLAGGVVAEPGDELRQWLEAHSLQAPVLALRALLADQRVTTVIPGFTQPEQVAVDVAAADPAPLSPLEIQALEKVRHHLALLGKRFCTTCGYCMPCSQEVNIAGIFRLWNILRGYGNAGYSKLEYKKMLEQRHWADFPGQAATACTQCGECLSKCPEGLPIPDDLKRAHEELTRN
jgi:predicted aldo/keto reductase-like oxidoreductase